MADVWGRTVTGWNATSRQFGWHLLQDVDTQLQTLLATLQADSQLSRRGTSDVRLLYSADHQVLYGLYFADDVYLLSHHPGHLQTMIKDLADNLAQ
eukprot:609218-Amphidinium_carterae.1